MCCKIQEVSLTFEREPLAKPFGFKGSFLSELWHPVCRVKAHDGTYGIGVGVQSVLWSDAKTFCTHTQTGSNAIMLAVTEYALQQINGKTFKDPISTQHDVFEDVYQYACGITNNPELPATFVLNALVPIDFALWQLWAAQNNASCFETLTNSFCPQMNHQQAKLGEIPLLSYNTSKKEIRNLLNAGAFILKIKIGSNPGNRNDYDEMCQWDISRIAEIHKIASEYETPYTECGHPVYYIDANGRYDTPERLEQFLAGAEKCGALERIVLLEEPFGESRHIPVWQFPVRIAGDESIHNVQDAAYYIDTLGYSAVALKSIAKTLSATLEIYQQAHSRNIPCFCADLTVPPVMLDWNMNVAARIETLPGLKIGIIESNGPQNYTDWNKLLQKHPTPNAPWLHTDNGVFALDTFYECCTAFQPAAQYELLLRES